MSMLYVGDYRGLYSVLYINLNTKTKLEVI